MLNFNHVIYITMWLSCNLVSLLVNRTDYRVYYKENYHCGLSGDVCKIGWVFFLFFLNIFNTGPLIIIFFLDLIIEVVETVGLANYLSFLIDNIEVYFCIYDILSFFDCPFSSELKLDPHHLLWGSDWWTPWFVQSSHIHVYLAAVM